MNDFRRRKDMFTVLKENYSYKIKDIKKMHPEEHLNIADEKESERKFRAKKYRSIFRIALIFIAIIFFLIIFVDVMGGLV